MTRISNSSSIAAGTPRLTTEFGTSDAQNFAGPVMISSEAGAAAVFGLLPDAVMINRAAEIIYANELCAKLLLTECPDNVVGRRVEEILVPLPDWSLAPSHGTRFLGPSKVLRGNGDLVEVDIFGGFVDWEGAPAAFLMLRDVTERREAERKLQDHISNLEQTLETSTTRYAEITRQIHQAKETADSANRTKSEFLANMSHELRTPLNAIMGFSEVIKDEMFGPLQVPQYLEYVRDIYNSGAHLLDIINDILDLSKVEAGKFELVEEEVELRKVVEAVRNLTKGRAEEKGLEIEISVPDAFPRLFADQRGLKQMLLNLTSNAIKFTPGGGAVKIKARVLSTGDVEVAVQDSGIGIAPEDMEKVLMPFGQVDSALARENQGTGLGLPLVQAMIELHGGELMLDSFPGNGTTASLRLPAARNLSLKSN
ncbi:MAG: ATP-binding protein [Alphaproteobacteria bacterium]